MNNPSAQVIDASDFLSRFEEKQREVSQSAETAGRSFSAGMADLIRLQQDEILRLHNLLRDNIAIPERHAIDAHVSSVANEKGRVEHVLLVIANDRSMWLLQNYSEFMRPEHVRWARVPALPQAADEIEPRK